MNSLSTKLKSLRRKLDIFNGQQRMMNKIQNIETNIDYIKSCISLNNSRLNDVASNLNDYPFTINSEKEWYVYKHIKYLHELLFLRDVEGHRLIRVGREFDGGYLMVDDFSPDMIAYSFGICDDVSWDKEMAKLGIHSFMYDHTINGLPEEHEFFHWSKAGICGNKPAPNCRTLSDFIKINGHEENDNLLLKMDVEGAEWDVISEVSQDTFLKFKQMIFEFHEMNNKYLYDTMYATFKKLNETHQAIHVHGNNNDTFIRIGDMVMPLTLEVLYVRKNDYNFIENNHFLPLPQDNPNTPARSDIRLGIWNNI